MWLQAGATLSTIFGVKKSWPLIITNIFASFVLALTPLAAWAEDEIPPELEPLAPVIITEVQTGLSGTGNASKEFIELYNTANQDIELIGWQLWYISATEAAVLDAPGKVIALGTTEAPVSIAAQSHLVIAHESYAETVGAAVTYSFSIAANGTLRLLSPFDLAACQLYSEDLVGWGSAKFYEGAAVALPSSKQVVARYPAEGGGYVDTNSNVDDFVALAASVAATDATPGQLNGLPAKPQPEVVEPAAHTGTVLDPNCEVVVPSEQEEEPPVLEEPTEPPFVEEKPEVADPEPSKPQPVIPAGNVGLKPPSLSEVLPNPASPLTDAADEFIELYNPNDAYFDLSGYVLEAGLTTKRRHTIAAGTKIAQKAFLALFSAQTKLALSNSGGQVSLLDPLGRLLAQSDPYGTAKDGQAWMLANGIWQWTTKPTPNALNILSAPAVKSASTTKKTSAASSNKTTTSAKSAAPDEESDMGQVASLVADAGTPLHPGVLAVVAVFAVLYGAYEYRRDVANRIYQFRANRAARRALRQSAERG